MSFCFLGLHNWKYFKRKSYPQNVRVCDKCDKSQELVYDFLTFWWRDVEK